MIRLTVSVLGAIASDNGRIVESVLFSKDPKEIADILDKAERSASEEELKVIDALVSKGIKKLAVGDPARFRSKEIGIELVEEHFVSDPLDLGRQLGLQKNEILDLIADVNLELTRSRVKEVGRDQIIIQAVNSLNDIEEAINRMIERLREWYSLHFPELNHLIHNHQRYAELVSRFGTRDEFGDLKGYEPELEKRVLDASKDSLGIDFSQRDIEAMKGFSDPIIALFKTKSDVESYIESLMKEIAPNTCELAGTLLGARIIALAGGMDRLSKLPSGTIQIMGAEDAFFRFLKTGRRPPKHGIIFQMPEIRSAPKNIRGKLSRSLAAKLAIACKIDAFRGKFIGDKLREQFLKRVNDLKE